MKKLISILFTLYPFLCVLAQEKVDYSGKYKQLALRQVISSDDTNKYINANRPTKISNEIFLDCDDLFLYINTYEQITFKKYFNGYKLYLTNKTDSTIKLGTIDGTLPIIAQVFHDNEWQNIEYLYSSWCGNSYYDVKLYKDEFWSFDIPKYSGEYSTKLRYIMHLDEQRAIFSNEIEICFNLSQLVNKPKDEKEKSHNTKQKLTPEQERKKNFIKSIYSK